MISTVVSVLLLLLLPVTHLFAADQKSSGFLNEPSKITAVETDTEALYYWRDHVTKKRPLILISGNPFLLPVPAEVLEKGKELALEGNLEEIRERAVFPSSNPTLLPGMGLSVATELDWFSEILWIVPVKQDDSFPTLEKFKASLVGTTLESAINIDSLSLTGECFSGTLDKTPLRICSNREQVDITKPALVHLDLSFFKSIYINPVKTPLHKVVLDQMRAFRKNNWPVVAATLSGSMVQGDIPLDVRFLIKNLVEMIRTPETLDKVPLSWIQFDDAMYLDVLFQPDQAHKIYLDLSEKQPDNPHYLFTLYKSSKAIKDGGKALESLAKAVQLDPVYAFEYLPLYETAKDKGNQIAALQMLKNAEAVFPANPWIKYQIAEFLAESLTESGHAEITLDTIHQLQKMTWSQIYYPLMPTNLEQFAKEIQTPRTSPK
jgi:hypothetical protein